jgi:hypothetical protein
MITTTPKALNMTLLAQNDLLGYGDGGEGMGMHIKNGRRTLFIAHAFAPKDVTAIDVTDPRKPEVIFQSTLPHEDMRSNCLSISGDIMIVCRQAMKPGIKPAGIEIFDISDPANPKSLSFLDLSGPQSIGAHFVWYVDGEYAYLSTGTAEWDPRNAKDRLFPVIVDVKDPTNPKIVGQWWMPGVHKNDAEPAIPRPAQKMATAMGIDLAPEQLRGMRTQVGPHTAWDFGYRSHNICVLPERPDRAYVGYISGGVIILDISDKSNPRPVGSLEYSPPMPGYSHTVVPLKGGDYMAITDECVVDNSEDYPKLLWLADSRYETHPVITATAPMPPLEEYRAAKGRFGAHNIHERQPTAGSYSGDDLVVGAFFTGGIRAYDVSNPFEPKLAGFYEPETPANSPAESLQMNDCWMDENGIIYGLDRCVGGLYCIEFNG